MQHSRKKKIKTKHFFISNKFSIIIPTLNEGKNLRSIVEKIYYHLKNFNFEIIIIDDNSNDGSNAILHYLKKKYLNLNFVVRKKKPDLSRSVIEGFEKSKYTSILVMDADMQHNPVYLPKMVTLFFSSNKDFVIGTRDFNKKLGLSFIRQNLSNIVIIFINLILGFRTKDPMSGFFMFKKKIYKKNKKKLFGKGFKILFDLLYSANELKIEDLFIKFNKRKNNTSKMSLKILFLLIQSIFYKFFQNKFNWKCVYSF
jgi:dolichol-phosphate mannosyltransferase